ncbi:hypothetical protein [Nannocystis bainbridge]|uniref:Lysozyme inhibitor LprI N-terminal domain-containing protein n=1 Tax=Nannocystis bainbridge TaxID=2995303 RepID=A0ABT5DSR8_9BACT|nr:hypothetical protein [Nannocystis bainbridge]MDC0716682.1 hypothetical protein [Nannocystis bainbridge]
MLPLSNGLTMRGSAACATALATLRNPAYALAMRVWLIAPMLLVLLACTEHDRRCAHARDVMLTLWEQSLRDTLPGQDEAELRRALAHAGERFMAQCRSLPLESQACIDRIDELGTVERERRAAVERCPRQADGRPESKCVQAARDRADLRTADCQLALGAMFTTILEP